MENTSIPLKRWWLSAASVLSLGIAGQAQVVQDSVQLKTNIEQKDSLMIYKGIVFDDFGPLNGASVTNISTGESVSTNDNGEFEIKGKDEEYIQVIDPYTLSEKEILMKELRICYEKNHKLKEVNTVEGIVLGFSIIDMECKPNLWQRFTNIFRSKENRKCSTKH